MQVLLFLGEPVSSCFAKSFLNTTTVINHISGLGPFTTLSDSYKTLFHILLSRKILQVWCNTFMREPFW